MMDELCRESELELHDARLKRVVIDLVGNELVLEVDAFRAGTEETAAARVLFGGLRRLSVEDVALERTGGQRVDVGEDADGGLWVFLAESNGFIRLRAASVTIESAVGVWTVRAANQSR